jgi:hypothetical protein
VALPLHDVDDAEQFIAAIVSRSGLQLRWDQRQDLEQYLLIECWKLSLDYQPGRITKGFAAYATVTLRKRIVDHQRSHFRTRWVFRDRVYERKRPELVSLNADDSGRDQLGRTLADGGMAGGPSGLADQLRALEARSCRPDGRVSEVGDEAA